MELAGQCWRLLCGLIEGCGSHEREIETPSPLTPLHFSGDGGASTKLPLFPLQIKPRGEPKEEKKKSLHTIQCYLIVCVCVHV